MFLYHRDLAILVLVINVIVYKVVRDKFSGKTEALRIGYWIWIILIIQIGTGLILSNFSLPPYAQGMHMLFSTVLFSLQYYLYLLVYRSSTYNQQN
jgi:cytochrome c oxidase assembly protein subunit 15